MQSQVSNAHAGLVRVVSREANPAVVEEELKHFIDSSWKWKAKKVSQDEFLVVFPNQMILDAFSRGMQLAMNKIKVTIGKTNMDTEASPMLQTRWIKMTDVPSVARTKETVKLIVELMGEVLAIDELSLIRNEPVRVQINCRNVMRIRGFIEIFIGKLGYEIKVEAEDSNKRKNWGGSGGPRKPDDKFDDKDDKGDKDDSSEDDKETYLEKLQREYVTANPEMTQQDYKGSTSLFGRQCKGNIEEQMSKDTGIATEGMEIVLHNQAKAASEDVQGQFNESSKELV